MRALETATLRHHRSMNPCPVYDEFTGIVFLFFIAVLGKTPEAYQIITGHNAARLCYVASSDQGLSWSKVTDLTEQVIGRAIEGKHPRNQVGRGRERRNSECAVGDKLFFLSVSLA